MGQSGLETDKKKAQRLKASIAFLDETGYLVAPLVRRTWAPCGQTPILVQKGRFHSKASCIGALVVNPKRTKARMYFRIYKDQSLNSHTIRDFLDQLRRLMKGPIVVVWDRLSAHKSKVVKTFLIKHPRIKVELLPPYAPELNPIEYAWGYLKMNPLANRAFRDTMTLAKEAYKASRHIQYEDRLLRSFIRASGLFLRFN
jgi:putative transposase